MKVEVPKWSKWERADGFRTPAGNSVTCEMASTARPPGITGPVELEWRMCGNRGDPHTGAGSERAVPNQLNPQERDRWGGEVGGIHSSDELG